MTNQHDDHRPGASRLSKACSFLLLIEALIAFQLGGTVSLAQTPVRDPRPGVEEPIGTSTLSGKVIDSDKNPVRRATVSIEGDMHVSQTMVTDDEGRFALANLPAGRFTVTADKAGYPSMAYGAKRPNRAGAGILLGEGQTAANLVLTLARGAVITGTVYDDHGQPLPEVAVQAWAVNSSLAGERTVKMGSQVVETDDRGVYRIFGLSPGDYTIGTAWYFSGLDARVLTDTDIREAFQAVTRPGTPRPNAAPPPPPTKYSYSRTYYPDTVDPLSARVLSLGPADVHDGIDLHLQFLPTSHIEGTVVGTDGSPAHGVNMVLFRHNRVGANPTTFFSAQPTGHFTTASLPPGPYTIFAQTSETQDAPRLWALQDVTLGGPEPAIVSLTLQPAMTMTGRLTFDASTLQPPDPTKVILSLMPVQGTNAPFNPDQRSTIDASGTFTLPGVTPGRFTLRAVVPGTAARPGAPVWSIGSVTMGGQDVTDLPIEIGTANPPPVIVTLTDRVSTLSGVVTAPAGQAGSDYFVVALPLNPAYWAPLSRRIKSTRPGLDGRYEFVGLPAGEYGLAATTDLEPSDLQDSSVLAELATHAVHVTLGLGEKKTFDLKLDGGSAPR
jgi:hypothetical protein